MKDLVVSIVALVIMMIASPAMAYVVVVATSIPLPNTADKAQIETALDSAVDDVLAHAIAFTPTVVRLENVRVVANRVYLLLLIADADGEKSIETFAAQEPSSADPEPSRETTPRFTY
jgi:uncharacterized membrane protein YedE/YeeE